ncbi:hypothetical protein V493_06827, partial [Pseudogymnoascus sp. VKM F-4281 (FW-2241)]
EGVELGEDEARVVVDVSADGDDGDAAVGDAEGFDVRARHDGGLDAFGEGDVAQVEVPDYAAGVGRVGIVVDDDFS